MSGILNIFWIVTIFCVAITLLAIILWRGCGHREKIQSDDNEWTEVYFPVRIKVVSLFLILVAGVGFGLFSRAIINDQPLQMWLSVIFGVPVVAGAFYLTYTAFFLKIRYNGEGVEYHRFSNRLFIPWDDVYKIGGDLIAGSVIVASNYRLGLSYEMVGFSEFLEEAKRQGVKIDVQLMRLIR